MDSKLKADWIAALRSGEFKQGRSRMGDEERGFCCLAVLCVVAGVAYSPIALFPSDATLSDLGLAPHHASVAAENNDNGETFTSIADWLESNPDV